MLAQAWQVEKSVGATLALLLKLARSCDLCRNTGTALAVAGNRGQGGGFAGDGQMQVDAIKQGTGKLVAVALNLITAATTAPGRVAEISTGAGVHCCDQLEACRKADLVFGAGDNNLAGLQWFTQHLKHPSFKFRH